MSIAAVMTTFVVLLLIIVAGRPAWSALRARWPFNRGELKQINELQLLIRTYGGNACYDGDTGRWTYYSPFDNSIDSQEVRRLAERAIRVTANGGHHGDEFLAPLEIELPPSKAGRSLWGRLFGHKPLKTDPYAVLGVPCDSSKSEIERAFKARLKANKFEADRAADAATTEFVKRRITTLRNAYQEIVRYHR